MGGTYSTSEPCHTDKEQFDKIVIDVALEVNNVSLQDVRDAVNYAWQFGARQEHSTMLWEYKRKLETEELRALRNLEN